MAKRPVPRYDFKAFGAAIKAAREEQFRGDAQVQIQVEGVHGRVAGERPSYASKTKTARNLNGSELNFTVYLREPNIGCAIKPV